MQCASCGTLFESGGSVGLTAREEVQLRERAALAGADAYLPKPFAYDELLAVVTRLAAGGRR